MPANTSPPVDPGRLYTYQELSLFFQVSYRTIRRHFRARRRFVFRGTVRIPGSELQSFLDQNTSQK